MKKIKLTQGKFALVDNEDFELLNQWKWSFDASTGYAIRGDKFRKKIYMHRVINNTSKGLQTDHINRDKLDNQRKNLLSVSSMLNRRNVGLRSTNRSGYKGVSFWQLRKKWQASIYVNYKKICLGTFTNIKDAIKARKDAERMYWA